MIRRRRLKAFYDDFKQMRQSVRWKEVKVSSDWMERPIESEMLDFSHDWRWGELVQAVYQWKPHRFVGECGNGNTAYLQLAKAPFPLSSTLSMPYVSASGIAIDGADDPVESLDLSGLFTDTDMQKLQLRQLSNAGGSGNEMTFFVDLPADSEALKSGFNSKLRSQINKPIKEGLSVSASLSELPVFYQVYKRRMKQLGSPWHSFHFFDKLFKLFEKESCLLTVKSPEGEILGGAVLMMWRGRASVPIAATDIRYRRLNPNMLLYWGAFEKACSNNCRYLDLGRSQKGSGTYHFKMQWEPRVRPLRFLSIYHDGEIVEKERIGYRSPTAQALSGIWKRIPLPLLEPIGGRLRKWIP